MQYPHYLELFFGVAIRQALVGEFAGPPIATESDSLKPNPAHCTYIRISLPINQIAHPINSPVLSNLALK